MLWWCFQIIGLSVLFICCLHYLLAYAIDTFTVPKTRDLSPQLSPEQYKHIEQILSKPSPTVSHVPPVPQVFPSTHYRISDLAGHPPVNTESPAAVAADDAIAGTPIELLPSDLEDHFVLAPKSTDASIDSMKAELRQFMRQTAARPDSVAAPAS